MEAIMEIKDDKKNRDNKKDFWTYFKYIITIVPILIILFEVVTFIVRTDEKLNYVIEKLDKNESTVSAIEDSINCISRRLLYFEIKENECKD